MGSDDLSDFSNNLASDLGPLLALFGEAMTRQYLSESTSFLDYFIFSMAPIGIITTMVSVIRVCGTSSLRAFVGRAQEGEGAIEAELCTSTSRDVCELFNKGGITRVLGRPDILELVYLPPSSSSSRQGDDSQPRLHLFRRYLEETADTPNSGWSKVEDSSRTSTRKAIPFAPKPNLSLNVGIKRKPEWVFYVVGGIGFILQSGIIVFAGAAVWLFGWNIHSGDSASKNYAPGIFIAGTVTLCVGTWSCAALIGQTTNELYYKRKKNMESPERLYWLQPGPQVIGDESFDSFAYSDAKDPLQDWISSSKDFNHNFQIHTFFAVILVLLGYISQFIGLRGLNAWVSIAQLGITVVMSVLRSALRMQRLNRDDNSLANCPDLVAGHELDWLAFEIVKKDSQRPHNSSCNSSLFEKTREGSKEAFWHITGQHEEALEVERAADQGTPAPVCDDGQSQNSSLVGTKLTTTRNDLDYNQLFLNRIRLSHLTGHLSFDKNLQGCQPWKDERVKVRANSKKLATAICRAAATLLQDHANKKPIELRVKAATPHGEQLVSVTIKPPADHAQITWSIDSARLEAILGLWLWSIVFGEYIPGKDDAGISPSERRNIDTRRIISVGSDETNIDMEMGLWLGTNSVQYPRKSIALRKGYKHSLSDLWVPGGAENTLESDINKEPDRSPKSFQRLCGWTLVYELPEQQRSDAVQIQSFRIDPTEYSLLDMCTQDLFIALLRSLAAFKWRNMDKTTVTEVDGNIRLENPVVADLTGAFVESGLGTYAHAVACIIPPFRAQLRPRDENLLSTLTGLADHYRHQGEWQRAEVVLQWACQYYSLKQPLEQTEEPDEEDYFVVALRTLGELYRWSLSQTTDEERQKFAQKGILWMQNTYGDSNAVVARYMQVAKMMREYHATRDGEQHKMRANLDFPDAIYKKQRVEALYLLCFLNAADLSPPSTTWVHPSQREALPRAVFNDWIEVVNAQLEMKVNPNNQDPKGRTAVSFCAELDRRVHLKRLIEIGAHLEEADENHFTPLHWAALKGNGIIIQMLFKTQQVDINRNSHESRTPLFLAAQNGQTAAVKQLLQYGADPKLSAFIGRTALVVAAEKGYFEIVKLLVEYGANIERTGTHHATPLIMASACGYEEMVKYLLDNKACVDAVDNFGMNPLAWAINFGYTSIERILRERGATIDEQLERRCLDNRSCNNVQQS